MDPSDQDGPEETGSGAPAAPATREPEAPAADPSAERAALTEELGRVRAEVIEQRAVRDEASRQLKGLETEETRLIELLDPTPKVPAHIRSQLNIQQYLKSQAEQRARRATDRATALGKLGGDTQTLTGKSPIDAAHSRRTGYGGARPKHVLPGG